MSNIDSVTQVNAFFKERYAKELENRLPENAILVKLIPFSEQERLGLEYVHPMILSDEQGVTYAGSDEDGYTLEDAEAMSTRTARLKGSQITIRGKIGFKAAASGLSAGPAAFVDTAKTVISQLMASLVKRLEVALLYGGSGLGKVQGFTNESATVTVLDFKVGAFSTGIWVGAQNAYIDFYTEAGALIVSGVQVVIPNVGDKTLKVTAASGDITSLEAGITALAGSESLDIFYRGAKDKEMVGIDQILQIRGSLFGVDNTDLDLHQGQIFDNGAGVLSFDKLTKALVSAINYGLMEDVTVWVSPETLQDLNNEADAIRAIDSSYSVSKNDRGSNALVYNHAGIRMEIKQHQCVKQGDAFIVPMKHLKRIGAWKESFKIPGHGGDAFRLLENANAFEMRAYTDQALFMSYVCRGVKINNIVNS